MDKDQENELFNLAADAVNFTSCNLFLTGKAGTGKTTFLKFIKEYTHKNAVVVAPTGVAAINAGGVTMHSFFQLPFLPYLPNQNKLFGNINAVDRHSLIRNIRFNLDKIELLEELELLIIDEVSMLRADMLDAIDEILRHFRRNKRQAFGGVQVLFIGDLFQLPPVVNDEEWMMMKEHYESPFFFSAKVMDQNPPLFIELKKIYRQSEERFISLLNKLRNNEMEEEDFAILEERYSPDAMDVFENSITLSTHNHTADAINRRELNKLEEKLYSFKGEITGNFNEKALPADMQLDLKPGAQIMFIKNDTDPEKRYYNGKLAVIKSINESEIKVTLEASGTELLLVKETWENIQYILNAETHKVEEEVLGSFTQYPVRLAWAITIHKSQGLTFDRAVIDAGRSFAAGQVYVALSRCRTLEGLMLLSRIYPKSVLNDERIIAFASRENSIAEIRKILADEKPRYAAQLLVRTFDWQKIVIALEEFDELTKTKKIPDKELFENTIRLMLEKAKEQQEVSEKFIIQLEKKFTEEQIDQNWLNTKVTNAKKYFAQRIHDELVEPVNGLQLYLKGKTKVRKYSLQVNELETFLWKKISDIQRATFGDLTFEVDAIERKQVAALPAKAKVEKGSSRLETLEFYRQGMKTAEIAKQRGMAESTIESHLADWVQTGDVNVFDFVTEQEIQIVKTTAEKSGNDTLTAVKRVVGDTMSYGRIKLVLNYLKKEKSVIGNQ